MLFHARPGHPIAYLVSGALGGGGEAEELGRKGVGALQQGVHGALHPAKVDVAAQAVREVHKARRPHQVCSRGGCGHDACAPGSTWSSPCIASRGGAACSGAWCEALWRPYGGIYIAAACTVLLLLLLLLLLLCRLSGWTASGAVLAVLQDAAMAAALAWA